MSKGTSAISRRGASRFWLGVATANSPKADGGQAQAFSSEYGESPPLRAQP